ncbi:hypothetical protein TRFO_33414 [Tritrichomonas foetus]|uniref:Nucleoporin Nup133/Nup155-like N-terminal domain-containing protein n=1 Tax=Tritrichomonas foetus TaxID=1144522 RepID=A0A1J4JS12_9EUKA|nr:hypothetical protein TRFO_33414 [Tritrichomonas foetus]|eukprot:OHT00029.1 hypothetical protein TRFO_33414 [Tritrichomonas foetus]
MMASTFDQDNNFIIKNIRKCYEVDEKVSNFFELLPPSDEFVDDRYDQVEITNDVAIITNTKPYPQKVEQIALSANNRVYFGAFIPINHYSCIVDNQLLMWPFEYNDDPKNVTVITEKAELVTAVSCGPKNSNVFVDKVKNVVVVATNRYIAIYPFTTKIVTEDPIKVPISSIITTISISEKGQIFVGSDVGDIFWIEYNISKWIPSKCSVHARNLTSGSLFQYCPKILRFTHSISQISICSLDDDSHFVAVLDSESNIIFYSLKDNKLKELSKYEHKKNDQNIISISSIPISDSTFTRFIAFTEKGDRLFFSWTYNSKEEIEIILRQIRLGPTFFSDKQLIDAKYSLGVSVFLFNKYLVITRTKQSTHIADINPSEEIAIFAIPSDGLIFERGGHIFSNQPFKLFNNEMLWQHLISAAPGYLMTSSGVNVVTFSLPVDRLSRILNESNGNYTDSVVKWMKEYHDESESSACALLLAAKYPPRERNQVLIVLYQFSKLLTKNQEFDPDSVPESCSAFILRAARLLTPIWNSPVFINEKKKIQINRLFNQLPSNFLQNLKTLIELANDYLHIKINTEQKKESIKEASIIQKFILFMKSIISTITFIQILRTLNVNDLTKSMEKVAPEYKERLLNMPFGSDDENIKTQTLFESLREFAAALFKGGSENNMQALQFRLFQECPDFFCEADSKILDAMESTEKADPNTPATQLPILQAACDVFVKHSSRPLKLSDICFYFGRLQFYQGIIDVSLSRAAALDPVQNALQWYKGGCQEDDEEGKEAFDKRYYCYQYIFEISNNPQAFPLILKTSDELFHICFYHYLIEKNDEAILERLFSTTTLYLEAYLKDKAPQYLWMYQARHKKYENAAKLLLNLVKTDKNSILETRIAWLLKVIGFARGSGSSIILHEAQQLHRLAIIQTKYNTLIKDINNIQNNIQNNSTDISGVQLLSYQKLFDKCSAHGFWDLVLQIFACCPIDGLNKKHAISQAWENFLTEQLWSDPLSLAQMKIKNVINGIEKTNEVLDPSILIPVLENFKYNKNGPLQWACDTLKECHISLHDILDGYLRLLNKQELEADKKADFIYITAILTQNNATVHQRKFDDSIEWFIRNAKSQSYYEDAFKLMHSLSLM